MATVEQRPFRLGEEVMLGPWPAKVTFADLDTQWKGYVGVTTDDGEYCCISLWRVRRARPFAGNFRKWGH